MKVIIDEEAYNDIEQIHAWITRDRPAAAVSVADRIFKAIERLGHFPYIGHRGREPGTYEWVVRGLPYIIVFETDDDRDELTVTGVFDGAREHRRL